MYFTQGYPYNRSTRHQFQLTRGTIEALIGISKNGNTSQMMYLTHFWRYRLQAVVTAVVYPVLGTLAGSNYNLYMLSRETRQVLWLALCYESLSPASSLSRSDSKGQCFLQNFQLFYLDCFLSMTERTEVNSRQMTLSSTILSCQFLDLFLTTLANVNDIMIN